MARKCNAKDLLTWRDKGLNCTDMRMNMIKAFIVLLLLVSGWEAFAQTLSNRGREFWVGYGHHQFMERDPVTGTSPNTQNMVLYLSAEEAAVVRVSISGTAWTRTYNVPALTTISTETATPVAGFPAPLTPGPLPKAGTYDCRLIDDPPPTGNGGDGLFNRHGIHIESDVPIVAYAHIYGVTNSGASMLMPTDTWGYSYVSVNSKQSYADNCFSWAYVVSNHDNTLVEIVPSVQSRNGRPPGVPFTVTLNRGEIYQVIGADLIPGAEAPEVSGTTFRSIANASGDCYPIAVFSGSSRTRNHMACNPSGGGGDNDNQQLVPLQAWGKRYLTAPTSGSNASNTFMTNGYKVLVKDPATQVRRNGTLLTGLTNSYYYFESNTADIITADKPIMVAQFMSGGGCLNGPNGDPEMIYISPMEQQIRRVSFFRNNAQNILVNYLTLILPSGGTGLSSLTIDGIPFSSLPAAVKHSYPHPQMPGYTVVVRRWAGFAAYPAPAPGQCTVQSDSAFTSITYGLGGAESYGYNAGTMINNLSAFSSIQNTLDPTRPEHQFTCVNTPVRLSALIVYQPTRLEWQLSQLGTAITPNADVIDNAPVSTGTVVIDGTTYYKYTLPGTYMFNVADTFEIPIRPSHPSIDNCYNSEDLKIRVIVKPKPRADFTFTYTRCTLDTAYFNGVLNTTDGYTLNAWNWTFPGPINASGQQVKHVFAPGTHNVLLSVVTAEGCASDTTKSIIVNPKPTTSFTAIPAAVCEDNSITFTPTSGYADPTSLNGWYWDFGNGNTLNAANSNAQTNLYPDAGTFTVKQVAKYGNLCISDTATQIITIHAKPNITFTYPIGCLPPGGLAQFTSTATTPDGQTLTSYAWNFGDPNANAGNPNTSTLQNPTHVYTTFGSYTVMHTAVTNNGCTDTANVTITLNVRPTLAFTPLTPVCENAPVPVSVANGSVTNGVPGTGIYRGPGTDDSGNFNPAVAGPGVHTIWYVYTTSAGCADSLSQDILVHAKPVPTFTYPNGGCLPVSGQVQFTNTSTIADAQTMTWSWNFGDPNANAGNPNTSTLQNPTHNYIDGNYDIELVATSANGCADSLTLNVDFNITPLLAYPALNAICESAAPISIASASVTNGATGTGVYSGPGTTSAGMFDPAAAGPGQHTITYTFTTGGNCFASITQDILVHAAPAANFLLPAAGCLPATGLVQFTNTSTIADAQTMTWSWNFDDPNANAGNPNTSTAQDPTHNFGEGTYDVSLTVTSSNGCNGTITRPATFAVTPALLYPALNAVCENAASFSVATASVTNGVTGTGVYNGPGVSGTGMFNPATAGVGTHAITYTFTSAGGCTETIQQLILVHAKPNPAFTFTNGCLPASGLAQFTNTSTIADAQTMTWSWNFGDPNANAGNPNTSTLQDPTHNYGEGSYSVALTATSSNGCVATATIPATFAVTPALAFPPLAPVCENPGAAPASIATAAVTNGISGTGVYSGPGVNATGMFDPNVAGAGIHTITYTFTTTGGCTQSIGRTIEVYPRPVASFTASNNNAVCLGQDIMLTSTASVPSGTLTTWNWNLGNSSTPSYTNGNPFTVTYASANSYTVQLVVVSDRGCFSVPASQTLTVRPLPVVNFAPPAAVCLPGPAAFTNQSSAPDNASLSYQWDFGDGSGTSSLQHPSYAYATGGSYTVTLTATSSFGCASQASQVLDDFFDKPVAAFTVTPQELCQGADNVFRDASTAPNSTITAWNWNFDDNTTSTIASPTKRFNNPGVYDVRLIVTNQVGCVSDPFEIPVTVHLQPVIDAGQSFIVPQGTSVQFTATANSTGLTFNWSPAFGLSDPTALRPTLIANQDATYTLTATGEFGCTATDMITVKIFKPVTVPNVFSPNGDNIHDRWTIPNLTDYPGATVEVFNRYGQKVFHSAGYGTPWDGTNNGKDMPVGTYYYVIQLRNGFKPMTGSVTIIR